MVTEKFIHVRALQEMDEEPPTAGQDQMLSLNNTLKCLGLSQTLGRHARGFSVSCRELWQEKGASLRAKRGNSRVTELIPAEQE